MSPAQRVPGPATVSTALPVTSGQRAAQTPRRWTQALRVTWTWFRAFRRTRPFWGGLWTMLAGAWIIRTTSFGPLLALSGGWSYSAGYILGGALVSFGLVAWFAPHYRSLVGIFGLLVALAAFVAANLGGYLIGSVLGIVGSSMIWAWGEKKSKHPRRRGRRRATRPEE